MSLHVHNLRVVVTGQYSEHNLLDSISFQVGKKERIAVVGSSGSGKTTLLESLAQLKYWDNNFKYGGEVLLNGINLFDLTPAQWRKVRGKNVGYIFQEPMACFNPLANMKRHLFMAWKAHAPAEMTFSKSFLEDWLKKVGLYEVDSILESFPHQMSGGQLQRIMFVSALWHKPDIILADEPFSSLDEKNKAQLQHLLNQETENSDSSILLSTHDPDLIFNWATRVLVLNDGLITLDCPPDKLGDYNTHNEFIKSLLQATKHRDEIKNRVISLKSKLDKVLEANEVSKSYEDSMGKNPVKNVFSSISLQLTDHKSLGITGPSGCGKSTLARILIKLEEPDAGNIYWSGKNVSGLWGEELRKERGNIQIVFQDTNLSLPPFLSIRELLEEVTLLNSTYPKEMYQLFESLGLSAELLDRLPSALSGGQRQRVSIVRALISNPKILILDEAINMLDPQHQFLVGKVLCAAQEKTGLALVFISHDIHWLSAFCQEILTLED